MKNYDVLESTNNSRVYRMTQQRIISLEENKCFFCGPHSGCNSWRKYGDRSWKRFRKTQYKNVMM